VVRVLLFEYAQLGKKRKVIWEFVGKLKDFNLRQKKRIRKKREQIM
jgi:hypothetical protein